MLKRILLDEVYTQEQVAALKSYAQDFWNVHTFKRDPDNPGMGNKLVFRKSDGELVGRLLSGEFIHLEELKGSKPFKK